VNGQAVSGNYFETLVVQPGIGRLLTSEDDPQLVTVISYRLWLRRFGGDAGIIGRQILINNKHFTVVGVTPREFTGFNQGSHIDITVPLDAGAAMGCRHSGG
jgi:hypothetical protein